MTGWMINALLFLTTIGSILCQTPPKVECYVGETKDLTTDSPNGLKTCTSEDGHCYTLIILEPEVAGHGVYFGCGKKCPDSPSYIANECKLSSNQQLQKETIVPVKGKVLSTTRQCHMVTKSKDAPPRTVKCPDGKCGWTASSNSTMESFQGCSSQCIHKQKIKQVGFKNPCEECETDMCNDAAKVAESEAKAKMAKPKGVNQTQPVILLTVTLTLIALAAAVCG